MKKSLFLLLLAVAVTKTTAQVPAMLNLVGSPVWEENFSNSGGSLNSNAWTMETGNGNWGWGNGELIVVGNGGCFNSVSTNTHKTRHHSLHIQQARSKTIPPTLITSRYRTERLSLRLVAVVVALLRLASRRRARFLSSMEA